MACGQQQKEASSRKPAGAPAEAMGWDEEGAQAGNSSGGPGCEGHGVERKVLILETEEVGTHSAHR